MFLHKLGSSDSRFRTLVFQDGMNILLADRTSESTMGDSRNGAGKTSFVKLLRYLLGGSLDASLKNVDHCRRLSYNDREADFTDDNDHR